MAGAAGKTVKGSRLLGFFAFLPVGLGALVWLVVNIWLLALVKHGAAAYALPLAANIFFFAKSWHETKHGENPPRFTLRLGAGLVAAAAAFGIALTLTLFGLSMTRKPPAPPPTTTTTTTTPAVSADAPATQAAKPVPHLRFAPAPGPKKEPVKKQP